MLAFRLILTKREAEYLCSVLPEPTTSLDVGLAAELGALHRKIIEAVVPGEDFSPRKD